MNRTLDLTTHQQLVDLNGTIVNFHVSYTVTSTNGKPFQMAIVEQEQLDSGIPTQFETVSSVVKNEMSNTDGIYKNYYIALKSQEPDTRVRVEIQKTDITSQLTKTSGSEAIPNAKQTPDIKSSILWYICVFVIIASIIYGVYLLSDMYTPKVSQSYDSSVQAPVIEDVELPDVELPAVELPTVELPAVELPAVELPAVELPAVELPTVELPAVELPAVELPAVELPAVELPAVELPTTSNSIIDRLNSFKMD